MRMQFKELLLRRRCLVVICAFQVSNSWSLPPEVEISSGPLYACSVKNPYNATGTFDGASGGLNSVSILTANLTTDSTYVFQSSFYAGKWNGSLKKIAITLDGNGAPKMAKTASWDAAEILSGIGQKSADPSPEKRKIYTSKIQPDKSLVTIDFQWNSLTADQRSSLNTSPLNGVTDNLGEKRLHYLRGVRNLENGKPGGIFRARGSILGDIINSNSVYVGSPALNIQGAGYEKFYESHKARAKAVYVGANDGMLHAFDADSGKELFAYIPNILLPTLNQLTNPDYAHRPYVDGTLAVSEALVSGAWKTILVSGLGGGAQGVFAMDVTNPAYFESGSGVLWEFTDSDDGDMGNQIGTPVIAKFKVATVKGIPVYRYFVVVSSGLNNYKDDGTGKYNATGSGALFLLSLDKGVSEKWELNVNYFKFKTQIKDTSRQNGLSAPAVVLGNNGAASYIYAGDLQGNLWRFDFNGSTPWLQPQPNNFPVFTAKDSQGNLQPITTQPKIVFAPDGGYLILFGTGKFIEVADMNPSTYKTQSFYGIYDATKNQSVVTGRSQLEERTLLKKNDGALNIIGNAFFYGGTEGKKKGWYFDFLESEQTGERSISNPVIAYGKLFFNTQLPGSASCDIGSGRSYSLTALTGLPADDALTGYLSQIGLIGAPILLQTGVHQTGQNPTGKVNSNKKYTIVNFGTGGQKGTAAASQNDTDDLNGINLFAKRFSWREIINWQELRDAAKTK